MYKAGMDKKKGSTKGTRKSPNHPLYGTPRVLIAASKNSGTPSAPSDEEKDAS